MDFNVVLDEKDTSLNVDVGTLQKIVIDTTYHDQLKNRDLPNQHPIDAVSGLTEELAHLDCKLDNKLDNVPAMTNTDIEEILKGWI